MAPLQLLDKAIPIWTEMVEPTEDQLVEFKILLDGNHPSAVAARKEFDSSKDLKRFYSAILNVLNKKPKNFNPQRQKSNQTTSVSAAASSASSAPAAPAFFGNGPPGMPAPVSNVANGSSKSVTRSADVDTVMSDSRDRFYASGLNGVGYDDNALDDIAQFGAFEPLGVSSFSDSLGLNLGSLSIGRENDNNSNSIDDDYHFIANSNGPPETANSTMEGTRELSDIKQSGPSQSQSFFGSDEHGNPIELDLNWNKTNKQSFNSSSASQNAAHERSNGNSSQNQTQQQHQYSYPHLPYGYGYGHPLGNPAGINNAGIPYPYHLPYGYPYPVAPPIHNSQYGQLEGYPSTYGQHGTYNPYVGYGLSSNDGQSNLSHNPYGMSQPNAYPGMPPPLPSEFYSMHMGQGQYLGDTGLREQQHQVHSQQMNGTNDRRNSQGAPTKPSTFERPLEQRRSKNSSPDLPVSTPSAAASQSIEASIKVKKEKKSRTEKKKARIGEGSNAGNVNKQTEGNEAKEEESKKEKNVQKEMIDGDRNNSSGDNGGNSKISGEHTKINEHDICDDGNVIMFGEIPVEISSTGNGDRLSNDIAFQEMRAPTKKIKAKSTSSKATMNAVSVTKYKKKGITNMAQVPDSDDHKGSTSGNTSTTLAEERRKAILSLLKK